MWLMRLIGAACIIYGIAAISLYFLIPSRRYQFKGIKGTFKVLPDPKNHLGCDFCAFKDFDCPNTKEIECQEGSKLCGETLPHHIIFVRVDGDD